MYKYLKKNEMSDNVLVSNFNEFEKTQASKKRKNEEELS
jgi:hypothetical protein